jgi:hypothetical protein
MNTATISGTPDSADYSTASNPAPCGTVTPTSSINAWVMGVITAGSSGAANFVAGTGYTIPTNGSEDTGSVSSAGAIEYQIVTGTSGSYSPEFSIMSPGGLGTTCISAVFKAN